MRLLVAISITMLLAASAGAQTPTRTINVSGEGNATAAPDMATIMLGVQQQSKEADAAMTAVARQSRAILDRLTAFGIQPRDIQTSGLSLNQVYDYSNNSGQPPKLVGFSASNRLSVRVRELDRLGRILDQVVSSGATDFQGLQFDIADRAGLLEQARRAAVADAMARAKLYADAAGLGLGQVLNLSESGGGFVPQPMMKAESLAADSMPVAGGELTISASVALTIAIE